uniref:Uncharacterized protein n=1 Tax=Strigops habroptila TaxID=2489341 RepID=A0A672TQR3_STRHB
MSTNPWGQRRGAPGRKCALAPRKTSLPAGFSPNANKEDHDMSPAAAPWNSTLSINVGHATGLHPCGSISQSWMYLHLSWFQAHKLITAMFQWKLPLRFGMLLFQHRTMKNLNLLQTSLLAVLIN